MNRFFFRIFFLIGSLFIISCSSGQEPAAKITIAIPTGPISLDPRIANDAEGDKISSLVCDGLFIRNGDLEVIPHLAKGYEKLSDTSYRFILREGVKFHDGSEFVAEDVVHTFGSIIDGKIASPFKESFEKFANIVAESKYAVRMDLKEPYSPFLSILTRPIVSHASAKPVCTGPYRVAAFRPDSKVVLEANQEYFGGAPKNKILELNVIKDDNVRVLKLIKGDIDLTQNAVPPMLIDSLKKDPKLEIKRKEGTVVTYLGFNLEHPVLSNKKVRQALAHAIDVERIISHKWKGFARRADSLLSPANWAHAGDLSGYKFDPSLAAKLLDEAGLKDPDGSGPKMRFNIIYKTSTNKERVDIAQMIADDLKKIGVGVRVLPLEWGTFFRDIKKGNFEIYTLSWVGVAEPDIFYETCHSSQLPPGGLNRDRYKNLKVDELVMRGRIEMDEKARKKIYAEVQKIVLEELPFYPLWYEDNIVVHRKDIGGIEIRPDASYRMFVNLEKK